MSPKYENERLWGHYIWIFIAEFGTVALYTVMFFYLRRRMQQAKFLRTGQQESLKRLNRVVVYMVIYPLLYLVLSLPLAAGRMSTARGSSPSKTYFGVAGCLMALSGFMDVLVYTLTRRHLMIDTEHSTTDRAYYEGGTDSQWHTNVTTTAGSKPRKGFRMGSRLANRSRHGGINDKDRLSPFEGSMENMVSKDVELSNLNGVYQQTTIEISHEPAVPEDSDGQSSRHS